MQPIRNRLILTALGLALALPLAAQETTAPPAEPPAATGEPGKAPAS